MKRSAGRILGIIFIAAVPLAAQDVSISLSAGMFFPRHQTYRDIYGTGIPASLEVWAGFGKSVGASAGISFLRQGGSALPVVGGDEEYPLAFRRTSFPLLLYFRFGNEALTFRIGAGMAYHSFREDWDTVDADFKGTAWSFLARAQGEVRLIPRLNFVLSVQTERVAPGSDSSPAGGRIDLGGLTAAVGLSLRIR